MTEPHAILVANSSQARLFERASFSAPLVEVTTWVHPESRMQASQTQRAPLGQSLAGRAGLAPRTDLKQQHRSAFAQTLAAYLKEAVAHRRMGALALVVSNPFMGELNAHLDARVQKTIVAKQVLDLTSLGIPDLDKRLRSEFRL